jgi:hypothetical protein
MANAGHLEPMAVLDVLPPECVLCVIHAVPPPGLAPEQARKTPLCNAYPHCKEERCQYVHANLMPVLTADGRSIGAVGDPASVVVDHPLSPVERVVATAGLAKALDSQSFLTFLAKRWVRQCKHFAASGFCEYGYNCRLVHVLWKPGFSRPVDERSCHLGDSCRDFHCPHADRDRDAAPHPKRCIWENGNSDELCNRASCVDLHKPFRCEAYTAFLERLELNMKAISDNAKGLLASNTVLRQLLCVGIFASYEGFITSFFDSLGAEFIQQVMAAPAMQTVTGPTVPQVVGPLWALLQNRFADEIARRLSSTDTPASKAKEMWRLTEPEHTKTVLKELAEKTSIAQRTEFNSDVLTSIVEPRMNCIGININDVNALLPGVVFIRRATGPSISLSLTTADWLAVIHVAYLARCTWAHGGNRSHGVVRQATDALEKASSEVIKEWGLDLMNATSGDPRYVNSPSVDSLMMTGQLLKAHAARLMRACLLVVSDKMKGTSKGSDQCWRLFRAHPSALKKFFAATAPANPTPVEREDSQNIGLLFF